MPSQSKVAKTFIAGNERVAYGARMPYSQKYGRQVGLVLPPDLVRRLDKYIVANDKYTSRSRVVADAIVQFLADHDQPDID